MSSVKEVRLMARHRLNQEASVEKQVSHLAARFRDEQTPMAGGAMSRSVPAPTIGLMVRANRVVRADRQPIERTSQNA